MRNFLKKRLKNERGLTLVELLAVIVILAIVALIAFVMIGNIIENSRKDAHVANAQQLIEAAKLYEAQGGKIEDGVSATKLQEEELLGQLTDPWTKTSYNNLASEESTSGNGVVTKEEIDDKEVYKVTLNSENCDITEDKGLESNLIENGRKVCDKD